MYCVHCGRKMKQPYGETCPKCGADLINAELDADQTRTLSKSLHNRLNASREEFDNAMVFVVLGAILLIIGIGFFFLAFKLPSAAAHDKVLTPTCFEFWVSMAGLVAGSGLLIAGIIRVIIQKAVVQKEIMVALNKVQRNKYSQLED